MDCRRRLTRSRLYRMASTTTSWAQIENARIDSTNLENSHARRNVIRIVRPAAADRRTGAAPCTCLDPRDTSIPVRPRAVDAVRETCNM